jgi:hypothetical protein
MGATLVSPVYKPAHAPGHVKWPCSLVGLGGPLHVPCRVGIEGRCRQAPLTFIDRVDVALAFPTRYWSQHSLKARG